MMTTSIQSIRELCLTLACDVHASGNGQGSVVNTAKAFEAYLTGDTDKLVKDGVGEESRPIEYMAVPLFGGTLKPDMAVGPMRFYHIGGSVDVDWSDRADPAAALSWRVYRFDPKGGDSRFGFIAETTATRLTDDPDDIAADYMQPLPREAA